MYDDHSNDKHSNEKIFPLKDNVHYRLFSLIHQYLIFLRELGTAERHLENLHKEDPQLLTRFILGNPHFEKVELELSSVFDSLVFQLSSTYDYISHLTCYICKSDKTKSLDWDSLASACNGKGNDFTELKIKNTIKTINSEFAQNLFNYRSRLIHRLKDQHTFNGTVNLSTSKFDLKIRTSEVAVRHFKAIRKEYPTEQFTVAFLCSWLVRRTFVDIETILDGLRNEILATSNFYANIAKPKRENGLMHANMNPVTKMLEPTSEGLWKMYKGMKTEVSSPEQPK